MYLLAVYLLNACCVPINRLIYSCEETDPVPSLGSRQPRGQGYPASAEAVLEFRGVGAGSGDVWLGAETLCSDIYGGTLQSRC